ncbi:MAG: hypothetical protein IJZ30_05710 [Alphaproteobacteria bacterium]|nr:hypothetical protein [Alphaproteobacteria bacterium]
MKNEILQTLTNLLLADKIITTAQEVTFETNFQNDLGVDSLEVVELGMKLENHYQINDTTFNDIPTTVGELIEAIETYISKKPLTTKGILESEKSKTMLAIKKDLNHFANSDQKSMVIVIVKNENHLLYSMPNVDENTVSSLLD